MPDPTRAGDRTKASRFRRQLERGEQLADVDQLWMAEYEEKAQRTRTNKPADYGRSRSGRKVNATFQMEEAAEAEGTGTAAGAAAAAALVAREEGRRLDSLTEHSVYALKEACAVYKDICLMLRERTEVLEHTHIEMLQSVRSHFIEATKLEGALTQRDAEQKPEDQLLAMLMARYLGMPAETVAAAAAAAGKSNGAPPRPPQRRPSRPPPNGATPAK